MNLTDEQIKAYAIDLDSNPVFKDLVDNLQNDAVKEWIGTSEDDQNARERAWHKHKAVSELLTELHNVIARLSENE